MRNTASRFFQKETFKKGYFDAPAPDIAGFKYGKAECPFCKEVKSKFITSNIPDAERCCLDCLQKNDFKFDHDSEFGIVHTENLPDYMEDTDATKQVSAEKINEMLLTPNFINIQGENWLTHCDDFMIFKGLWEPHDFTARSIDNNGKKLFMEMTEGNYDHLWESCGLDDDETRNIWEDVYYYAFECKHCKKMKGYWDCS
jgi:uncharacterized protein CbrC (UPF0167 family)